MSNLLGNKSVATDVMAKDISAEPVNTDARVHTRLGWIIVLFGIGGFLLWALFAPLDQGVPVSGSVMVSSNRKIIQHQNGGTVDDILVKDGDIVKAGQPLVKMNETQAKSAAEVTRVQYYSVRAAEARLIAERDGKSAVVYPEDLMKLQSDPRVAGNISLQSQLFSSRTSAVRSELSAFDENIAGLRSQITGLKEITGSIKEQISFVKEQLDGMRDLAKDGYVARNRLLDVERTYAQLTGGLSENISGIAHTQRQIAEVEQRRIQRQQENQKEIRTQLADVQKEAEALQSRLQSQDFDLSNTIVRAPVDGTIVGLNVFTKGGVVGPGAHLMDIVPSADALIVEATVPVNLIDKMHTNLKVEMIFSAFNSNKTPHIPGVVTQVAADKTTDEHTGQSFYKIRAQVAPEGLKLIKDLQIRPGMPVELFVRTGERTMMSYLMKPIFDRAKTSLTEE